MTDGKKAKIAGLLAQAQLHIGQAQAKTGIARLELAAEDLEQDEPEAAEPVPRAVVRVGSAKVQRGHDATLEVTLEALQPIAGFFLNLRHSPQLEFLKAETPLARARFVKSEGADDHSRHLVSFTTDAESSSAELGAGLVQVAPGAVILRVTYRVRVDLEPGQYPVDGGRSGIATPGVSRQSWPTELLGLGSGGIRPVVERGFVEVTA